MQSNTRYIIDKERDITAVWFKDKTGIELGHYDHVEGGTLIGIDQYRNGFILEYQCYNGRLYNQYVDLDGSVVTKQDIL